MISICIPVRTGGHIKELLDSIFNSTYNDFEVIISNATSDNAISEIIKEYNVKEIIVPTSTGLFMGRNIPHRQASGEYELMLDETRIISRDLLEQLNNLKYDMVAIGEQEVVESHWTYLANIDKESIYEISEPKFNGYVLPRYFKKRILDSAFESIENKLPNDILNRVIYDDHQIVSYESFKISKNIYYLKDKLIKHYGDNSLNDIIKKYHRYGHSSRVLIGTPYEFVFKYRSHKRSNVNVKTKIKTLPLFLARGVPFLIGRLGI